jgi:hypothetical protein
MKSTLPYASALLVLLSLALPFAIGGQPASPAQSDSDVLFITLEEDSANIVFAARTNGHKARIERFDKGEFRRRYMTLYTALESRGLSDAAGQRMIEELGEQVLIPFQSLISSADEIVFVVSDELLEAPLDLFLHKGQPLFLQKPVSYRVSRDLGNDSVFVLPTSAFVVSDATADPEQAAKTVASAFDGSQYFDMTEIGPEQLGRQQQSDLLLMSVHGKIDNSSEDHVVLGRGAASAADFSRLKPRLAYFDSCRLGVSRRFLDGFEEIGTRYFVAPILSNEAGNSSTKTMQLFFKHLRQGERPELALFHARKKLWDVYAGEEFAYRVWRAFPFRVYRLN